MDGATLLRNLREVLGEQPSSAYLDNRSSYRYLWEAATATVRRAKNLQSSTTLTTVADTTAYVLPADFLELHLRDHNGELFLRYNDGTSDYFLNPRDYDTIVYQQNTTSQSIPDVFAIIDKPTLYSQITGTATSAGTVSAGLSTLTDTAGLFTTTDYVSVGDIAHNSTASASGVVISITSANALVTAMFNDSTGASVGWTQDDAYVIQPQGRMQIVLDPPPSTASHSVYVYYLQRPAPVFHDYGVYRFPAQYMMPLVHYAAWLYKYRDQEPNFGDAFYKHWEMGVRSTAYGDRRAVNKPDFYYTMRARRS